MCCSNRCRPATDASSCAFARARPGHRGECRRRAPGGSDPARQAASLATGPAIVGEARRPAPCGTCDRRHQANQARTQDCAPLDGARSINGGRKRTRHASRHDGTSCEIRARCVDVQASDRGRATNGDARCRPLNIERFGVTPARVGTVAPALTPARGGQAAAGTAMTGRCWPLSLPRAGCRPRPLGRDALPNPPAFFL